MLKKSTVTLSLALLASLCLSAKAASQYPTFEQAQQHVTDTGYIVFIYPAGWDKYGEKLCKKLITTESVKTAAGDAALLLAPIYQIRDEKNNAAAKNVMGALSYPGDMADISYPAIVFY